MRDASARPNLATRRGRHLISLPGSFKTQVVKKTPARTKAAPAKQDIDNSGNSMEEPELVLLEVTQADDTEENGKDKSWQEESMDASYDKNAAKRNLVVTTNITKLGKIDNIETDNPVMKVPFEDGRS